MTREYTYIPVSGKYFCVQGSLLSIIWIFLVKHKKLQLASLGLQQRRLPGILKRIVRYRLMPKSVKARIITLPVCGDLCIQVHRGYKVFDFYQLTATKFFETDVDSTAISGEIESVSGASALDFAPTLLESDLQNRWYRESFIPGRRSLKTAQSDPTSLFEDVIAGHLADMILSKPVKTASLNDLLRKLRRTIDLQLEQSQLDESVSTNLSRFIDRTTGELEKSETAEVSIAFTHGDFSFVNFLYNNGRVAVIDWESAEPRSVLHDLYNFFFTEVYYERIAPKRFTGFRKAILTLTEHLTLNGYSMSGNLADSEDIYRRLFYLERVNMLLERACSTYRQNVLRRTLDVFNAHEEP